MRFCLLGSGSGGNAVLVTTPDSKFLIDNGLSFKQLQSRALGIGETLDGLKAVFVTHEHSDHVTGVGILARKIDVPVYMTRDTFAALPHSVGQIPSVRFIEAGEDTILNGVTVGSFSISHDAADPVSFVVESEGIKLGIAADMGQPSELVRLRLAGSNGLILESNYCPNMLRRGSYPPMIQQRIRGRQGHLSNSTMCSLLSKVLHEALRVVVLVHISAENNTHDLALSMAGRVIRGLPVQLVAAFQDRPTPIFDLGPS